MYISKIALKNWKSYHTAAFDFPAPSDNKNIVLIGAPNGYGKTSLFEAIALGLFGRDGLHLIGRSQFSGADEKDATISYKKFLEKVLYRGSSKGDDYNCSVTIELIDEDGEPLEIHRTWHFSKSGIYNRNDDDVKVYEGTSRTPLGPSSFQAKDLEDWIRGYVAQKVLPPSLARFFLFDGEQLSILAEQQMSSQIKHGIWGLLGIPILKELVESLQRYARDRQKDFPKASNEAIKGLENELFDLNEDLLKKEGRIAEVGPSKEKLQQKYDSLFRELASYGPGSMASVEEQYEKIKNHEKGIEEGESKLENLLTTDLALALSGRDLRKKVKERLSAEGECERWKMAKKKGDEDLEKFLKSVSSGIKEIEPKLDKSQRDDVLKYARVAWEGLWFPPPSELSQGNFHLYLNDSERSRVIEQLSNLDKLGSPMIDKLLDEISAHEKGVHDARQTVGSIEAVTPDVEKMKDELEKVNKELQEHSKELGALENEKSFLEGQIGNKTKELERYESIRNEARPSVRRAVMANKVARIVKEIIDKSVPTQIEAIATEMTKAYKSMAHKQDQVKKIEIDESCDVKLFDGNNQNMRDLDLSAGEKQIFTQSLIHAVSSVSRRGFPMVIDTPLGRLDDMHRKGVLKHLAQRGHQVILLSTDTEVVGEYLKAIRGRVQRQYLIDFEAVDDVGQSTIKDGYFTEEK